MKSVSLLSILFSVLSFLSSEIVSETRIDFSEIWMKVRLRSAGLRAKAAEVKSVEIGKERAGKHWLPKIYADVRSYRTDDPALNFTGKLGQRSATTSDFSTESLRYQPSNFLGPDNRPYTEPNANNAELFAKDTLNHPGSHTYSRGTLGIELPLFEGGGKIAAHSLLENRLSAVKSEEQYLIHLEYSNAAAAYQTVSLAEENLSRTETLLREIKNFLSNYRLGNRSNPVGFSGFLSLKTLQNILEISKKEHETLRSTSEERLRFMTDDLPEDFKPRRTPLLRFADEFLPLPDPHNAGKTDLSEAYRLRSEEAKEAVKAERSKFLPKIAAFAESYTYDGSRDRANAYNAGLYLRMNLLDPSDLGAMDQAKADLDVARKKAEETKLREESSFRILILKERNTLENLNSIYDSMRIQEEQLRISAKLFREGTISAPQMAESFSKSAELLRMKSDAESEYLKTRAELSLYSKRGARHEN